MHIYTCVSFYIFQTTSWLHITFTAYPDKLIFHPKRKIGSLLPFYSYPVELVIETRLGNRLSCFIFLTDLFNTPFNSPFQFTVNNHPATLRSLTNEVIKLFLNLSLLIVKDNLRWNRERNIRLLSPISRKLQLRRHSMQLFLHTSVIQQPTALLYLPEFPNKMTYHITTPYPISLCIFLKRASSLTLKLKYMWGQAFGIPYSSTCNLCSVSPFSFRPNRPFSSVPLCRNM
jgi:hypothetical protein